MNIEYRGDGMLPVGEVIAGRYRIRRPLAAGGMSHVWLAHDDKDGTTVVVKQCAIPGGLTPAQREMVRRWAFPEARAAARVRHPNLVRTLDVLPHPDGPWIVLEYLPSRSLHQVIEESGGLPPVQVARIGLAVLAALEATAGAGLLHLDVKPGNVLITEDGRAVLTDFGPVVTPAGVAALTGAGVVLGSPRYIAPERLFGLPSTTSSDLWSLGATLYHAVEGRPPYPRATTAEILDALAATHPDPPRRAGPLTPVLAGLLRRDPSERLSADEVETLLLRVARAGHRRPSRPAPHRRLTAAAAMVTVAGMLTAVTGSAQGTTSAGTREALPTVAAAAPSTPPEGFRWWEDPAGFRLAVPRTWPAKRQADGDVVFTAPQGGPTLRVSRWPGPTGEVVAAMLAEERRTDLPAYRRLRIQTLAEPPGALWEYTFQTPDAVEMRGLRRLVGGAGEAYLIECTAARDRWVSGLPQLSVVLGSFVP